MRILHKTGCFQNNNNMGTCFQVVDTKISIQKFHSALFYLDRKTSKIGLKLKNYRSGTSQPHSQICYHHYLFSSAFLATSHSCSSGISSCDVQSAAGQRLGISPLNILSRQHGPIKCIRHGS